MQIGNYEVTLSGLNLFRGMEGYGINANINVQKCSSETVTSGRPKKIALAMDEGAGGEMRFEIEGAFGSETYKANEKIFKEIEEELKTRKPLEIEGMKLTWTMALLVDELAEDIFNKKEAGKLKKRMEEYIIVGIPGGDRYGMFKLSTKAAKHTVTSLIETEHGRNYLKKIVDTAKSTLKPGEQILNTNLPKEFVN